MSETNPEGSFEITIHDKDGNLKFYEKRSNPITTQGVEDVLRSKGYFSDPVPRDPGLGVVGNVAYSSYVIFVISVLILEMFIIIYMIRRALGTN